MEFKDKFVGFVDILGWKDMVKAAEARAGMALSNLVDALKDLGTPEDRNKYEMYGPRDLPPFAVPIIIRESVRMTLPQKLCRPKVEIPGFMRPPESAVLRTQQASNCSANYVVGIFWTALKRIILGQG